MKMRKILLMLLLFVGFGFGQPIDVITRSSGETISELYSFKGNHAVMFITPDNLAGTTLTWMVSFYEDADSLMEVNDIDGNLLYSFTVASDKLYQFAPYTSYGMRYWAAYKTESAATADEFLRIRPGKYD